MAKGNSIAISSWSRQITVPIGKTSDIGAIDLNSPTSVTIKGKIVSMRAEEPADKDYKGDAYRPAEITIEIDSVDMGDVENTFTTLSDKMENDMMEID